MMKIKLFISLVILLVGLPEIYAQDETMIKGDERLNPLSFSSRYWKEVQYHVKARGQIDSTFFYVYDTLSIPFIEDFSLNRFQSYEGINAGDPNVTEVLYYALFDDNQISPLDDTSKFMLDTTFRVEVDTNSTGSFIYNYNPLPDEPIFVNDLDVYPVIGQNDTVWPRYTIYDTLYFSGDQSDTVWMVPDIVQDSARVFEAFLDDEEVYWLDDRAYHNYHFAWEPKSLGVATFDGTDSIGYPYDFGSILSYGEADVLTSKPIDLSGLTVADSVYMTFIYQAGGRGEFPDAEDSLILEFYTPGNGQWLQQWTSEEAQDSSWRTVHIRFDLNALFENGFQFRFKNFGNLSGSFDHWHIDYIRLRATSTLSDTLINDLAIMEPTSGLIQPYTYAPWKHYKEDPAFFMNDEFSVRVTNNFNQSKLTDPGTLIVEYEGVNQLTYNVGDPLGNYNPATIYDFPFDFSAAAYEFDPTVNDSTANFTVKSVLTTPTNPELLNVNDTTVYEQDFRNYYAYDDGTAEAAYGPYGLGAKLAYHFEMPQADTLLGAMMHFEPSAYNMENTVFLLTVWKDNNGLPGQIIYQDDFFTASTINYDYGDNGYSFYSFASGFALEVDNSFFIGWEQIDPDELNIGFDFNNNNQDKIFYNANGAWANTVFQGSLMIRPVVKSNIDFYLGVDSNDIDLIETLELTVFPNPASDQLTLRFNKKIDIDVWTVELMNNSGQTIYQNNFSSKIDVDAYEAGFYLLKVENRYTGEKIIKKVIKH